MPRKEHPGIGRRVPRLLGSLTIILIGLLLLFREYTSGFVGDFLDWLRGFDASRPYVAGAWQWYRRSMMEPSPGLGWVHIVGMVLIVVGLVLILWRSQKPPERDPE